MGGFEHCEGVLVTLTPGRIVLVGPKGEQRLSMTLDLPMETPAVAGDLEGKGNVSIIAVDAAGSVYCFDERGNRRWKHARAVKSGEFRLPVFADLDGDGHLEIVVVDSRGTLLVLDGGGRVRMEIGATKYRLSVPAVADVNGDGKSELIFGTEAGEVYCITGRGDVLWETELEGCFGRALPLMADADRDGKAEVYFATAFNNPHPGLFALDAATGKRLWKAPSVLQSYRSAVAVDMEGNGVTRILFGDKSSTVFCLDAAGKELWSRQLPGRGIFFAPAVLASGGRGAATAFFVVRGSGPEGKSLYALDAVGNMVDALLLNGGGGGSPLACRFKGRSDVSLLVLSGSGQLACYSPAQADAAAGRILWPGSNGGVVNRRLARKRGTKGAGPSDVNEPRKSWHRAHGGTNKLPGALVPPEWDMASIKTVRPDRTVRLDLVRKEENAGMISPEFQAGGPGKYDVTLGWYQGRDWSSQPFQVQRFGFSLEENFAEEAAELKQLLGELETTRERVPLARGLMRELEDKARTAFENARSKATAVAFDVMHRQWKYEEELQRACRKQGIVVTRVMVRQLKNPWENFDETKWNENTRDQTNGIKVTMLGNEYESAAIAMTNLRPEPTTYRLVCQSFQNGTNRMDSREVLTIREVSRVRPDGTGDLTEDPLPLLGAGQTVKLAGGETRKLWLTFHSRLLSPGAWQAQLTIEDVNMSEPIQQVPIGVEVSPVRLPERFTYRECNWLYLNSISDEAVREATKRDAIEHGMNVFVIPGVSIEVDELGRLGQSATEAHDRLVRELRGPAFFLVSGPVSVQWPASVHPGEELQEKTFAQALHWYAEHMRSLGCGYEEYAIYLQDEPGLLGRDAAFEGFVAQVRRFKSIEPKMQLYANPAGGARAELLRPLEDLIDVWAPDLHLVREQPDDLSRIFKKGKQYWHYEAPGDQRTLDALGFYRMKPWVAFGMGMTGGGYWVYSDANFWEASPAGGSEYGSVYPTDKGPVTTKRWEASRDGIEDFELLWLLRNTGQRSEQPLRDQAQALIREAVAFVTRGQEKVTDISRHVRPYTPDYAEWMRYRRELIAMQMRLTNK